MQQEGGWLWTIISAQKNPEEFAISEEEALLVEAWLSTQVINSYGEFTFILSSSHIGIII